MSAKLLLVDGKLIVADGKILTPPSVIIGTTRISLIYDETANSINLNEIPQNYNQIKALLSEESNDVLLYNSDKTIIYQPSAFDGYDMIEFTATYIYNDEVHINRVAINTSNEVNYTGKEIALKSQLGGLSLVKLTQAEYDALETKDSNTLYVIVG